MDGPWSKYQQTAPAAAPVQADGPWSKYAKDKSSKGMFWPLSTDQKGHFYFDPDTGIVGAAKQAFELPGKVYRGETQVMDPMTGHVSQDIIPQAMNFASFASPANPAITAGDKIIPGMANNLVKATPPAPSASELLKAGSNGFDSLRDLGVDYSGDSIKNLAFALQQNLEKEGKYDLGAGKTHEYLNRLQNVPEGGFQPLAQLHSVRKGLGEISDPTNKTDSTAARQVIDGIDSFISSPPEGSVLAGPSDQAGQILNEANGNWAAGKRAQTIDTLADNSDLRAASTHSGQNGENRLRQALAGLVTNDSKNRGFSDEEIAALEKVVRGSTGQNVARGAGNILGGGGGLGMMLSGAAGSALGGSVGMAALPAAGFGLKALSSALGKQTLANAQQLIASRSPLYEAMANAAPMATKTPYAEQAVQGLARALMMQMSVPKTQKYDPNLI